MSHEQKKHSMVDDSWRQEKNAFLKENLKKKSIIKHQAVIGKIFLKFRNLSWGVGRIEPITRYSYSAILYLEQWNGK